MRTAILIPSLGRSQYVRRTYGNIEANTPEPHDQWWCVTEEYVDTLLELIGQKGERVYDPPVTPEAQDPQLFFITDDDDDDHRYVTRMNKLVRHIGKVSRARTVPSYDYMFFGSDDVVHHPHWLSKATEVMEGAPGAQVVVVNDLRNPNGTQALVRTSYLPLAVFDDPHAAFHHGYHHQFADNEMFMTAAQRGVIYRAPDSHVEHLHPSVGGSRPWDATYIDAREHWDEDAALYHRRMELMRAAVHA